MRREGCSNDHLNRGDDLTRDTPTSETRPNIGVVDYVTKLFVDRLIILSVKEKSKGITTRGREFVLQYGVSPTPTLVRRGDRPDRD